MFSFCPSFEEEVKIYSAQSLMKLGSLLSAPIWKGESILNWINVNEHSTLHLRASIITDDQQHSLKM